jgi:cell division protein FtsI/penicillin-binding protein 2
MRTGRDVEIATAAYGQGIAISPIAVTKALSILANGGYTITPHLVKEIRYSDGTNKVINIQRGGPVLKKQTTDDVTKMLVKVVDNTLLQGKIKDERYSIAAKTGTAQMADHTKGGYYPDRYLHSFFGYFPAYNPKYLVFLFQVYPKGTEYAADTLTDPFDQITKFLINYFNIAPGFMSGGMNSDIPQAFVQMIQAKSNSKEIMNATKLAQVVASLSSGEQASDSLTVVLAPEYDRS